MGHQSKVNRSRRAQPARPAFGGVVVAYIHPGQTSAYFTESMLTTSFVGWDRGWLVNVMQEWSSANVSAARNTVTQRFLDQPHGEWLLWVDSDMHWTPDAVETLLEVADADERPIVGGLCFGMSQDMPWPTIYQWTRLEDGSLMTVRVGNYPRDTLVQVAATGAAFLLIHRRTLEAIKAREFNRTFPWFQETEHHGNPVGEDLTFCIRAGILTSPRAGLPSSTTGSIRTTRQTVRW